jgi:hypothetical protein
MKTGEVIKIIESELTLTQQRYYWIVNAKGLAKDAGLPPFVVNELDRAAVTVAEAVKMLQDAKAAAVKHMASAPVAV